jgi:PAS domain S-box-containing protein
VQHWTKGAEIIFGYTDEVAIGQTLDQLIALPGQTDDGPDILRVINAGRTDSREMLRRKQDGSLINIAVQSKGIANAQGQLAFILSTAKDITEMNLPGISGAEAQKILRDDPLTAHIPVIALTANAMANGVRQSIEAGFFRYLTKPIRIAALTEAIDSALKRTPAFTEPEDGCRPS